MIHRERRLPDKTEIHIRYYITSLEAKADRFLMFIREHWGVENCDHWVLDIAFNGDHSRLHKDNGAENLAVIRHIALNLLRNEKTAKVGIKAKGLKAGWMMITSSKSSLYSAIALAFWAIIRKSHFAFNERAGCL
jgi:hypothetical protein